MGSTKIGYLSPKIEFSTKKYINIQILVTGHDQTRALPPHPTVYDVQILMKSKKEMVHLLRVGEFDLTLLFSDW